MDSKEYVNPQETEPEEEVNHATAPSDATAQAESTSQSDATAQAEAIADSADTANATDSAGQPETPPSPEEQLAQELRQAQEARAELQDKYLRLSAEFDNYRKRTMREKAELILNGGEKAFTAILPVLDDLERALGSMGQATDVQAFGQGVELIYNKFLSILAQNGVKPIDTVDQPLDTDYHEAIAMIPAPTEAQRGRIIDCVQRGYTINNKVLRHAKVVVGQ